MEDLTGKQLSSYQIVAPLGEGGMAAVYKAYQPGMDRYVALKILPRHFARDPQFVARFEQEAKVLAKLQHPHILPVFDYGEADGYTYIVMPFLQSGDLTDLLKGQPLSLAQTGRIISQIGDALDYAHSQGLIHRDVKPSNVLLDERGNCLLTDFGIAKIVESSSNLTATGGILGTPAYMSPEQGLAQKLDGRSDIYSLGIMLYELATGRVPYQAETPMAVVIKHMNDPLPPPRQVNSALPEAVERVILKALAKQPENRYATAGEMVRALQAAVVKVGPDQTLSADDGATITATAGTTLEARGPKTISTRKWISAAGVFGIVLFVGAIVFFAVGSKQKIEPEAALIQQAEATTETTDVTVTATEQAAISRTVSPTPPAETKAADTPVTYPPTDTTIYEDFNDPAFDGKLDTSLWRPSVTPPSYIEQREGILLLSLEPKAGKIASLFPSENLKSNQFNFAEAKMLLSSGKTGQDGDTGLALMTTDKKGQNLIFLCVISRSSPIQTWCEVYGRGSGAEYVTEKITTNYDVWHTARIEMDTEINATFYIDGEQVGSYRPNDAEEIKGRSFTPRLEVWSPKQDGIEAHFDDVRIGQSPKSNFTTTTDTPIPSAGTSTPASPGASIAGGTILFEEDFEDDKLQGIGFSAEPGWKITADETGNKVYEIDNRNGPNYKGFSFGITEWKDYSVEYRARFLNSTGKQSEIGSQYRSDGNSYYVLDFSEAELYLAYSINGSEWTRLVTQFPHIEPDIWYNIKVNTQGEQISVYLDNALLVNAESSEIQQGWSMIFVGPDTYAQIDDIRVVALGE